MYLDNTFDISKNQKVKNDENKEILNSFELIKPTTHKKIKYSYEKLKRFSHQRTSDSNENVKTTENGTDTPMPRLLSEINHKSLLKNDNLQVSSSPSRPRRNAAAKIPSYKEPSTRS